MGALSVRSPQVGDLETIRWIVARAGVQPPDEAEAVLAQVERALNGLENETGALTYLLEDGGLVVGLVSFGPVLRTTGTWGLQAVVVETGAQGRGCGRHLMAFAEGEARRRGGHLMLIELRARAVADEEPTFFERVGYARVARVPGYYGPGEDRWVFSKELEPLPRR